MSVLSGDSLATRVKKVKKKSSNFTETMKALQSKMLKVSQINAKEFSSSYFCSQFQGSAEGTRS